MSSSDDSDDEAMDIDEEELMDVGDEEQNLLDEENEGECETALTKPKVHRPHRPYGERKFQKEISYNRKLPYYDQLSTEADNQLRAIKAGLARSVLLRDVRPALLHWACELDKYIYLNGYRFTKEDHLWFVRLMYEMVVIPNLELRLVKTFAHILDVLLRKKELLSRDDLTLDWRPLYKLYELTTFKNLEEDGLFLIPKDIVSGLEHVIRQSRTYFSLESTKEILELVRPLMCPWDMSFSRACQILSLFLPTSLLPEHADRGYKIWLDEIIFWWLSLQNGPPWESRLVQLLARLALHNVGYIDWNPYLPEIFTKLLRSFGLSVVGRPSEKIEVGHNGKLIDAEVIAIWVASMLGGKSDVMTYVNRLFRAVESYLHPSNHGKWQEKILNFVQRLALSVCQRVQKERHRKPDWQAPIPEDWRLTDKQLEQFVQALLPCALNGMFAKARSDLAVSGLRCLSHLCPKVVVPAVLEKLYPSLDTLTEPHRLTQSMNSMVGVVLPMIRESGSGNSRHHVIPLMNAILPGLDPNDVGKSMVTLQALSLFSILVPLVDCSEAVHLRDDLTEEEKELCSATSLFEDYINQFMDRVFVIVETFAHSSHSGTHRSKGSSSKMGVEENLLKSGMYSAYRAILSNTSTELYKIAVGRLFHYLEENTLEGRVSADMISELCYSAVRTNTSYAFPLFFELISKRLKSYCTGCLYLLLKLVCLLISTQTIEATVISLSLSKLYPVLEETYEEEEVEEAIVWHLVILGQLVRCDGAILFEHRDDLISILKSSLRFKAKDAYEAVSNVIDNLLMSLSFLYVCEHETERKLLDRPLDSYLPVRHWAEPYERQSLHLKWHIPSEKEVKFIKDLLQLVVFDQLTLLSKPQSMKREAILRSLSFIKAGISGAGSVLPLIASDTYVTVVDSQVEFSHCRYLADPKETEIDYDGKNVRATVYDALHELMEYLLTQRADETRCLMFICAIYNLLMFHRGLYKQKFDTQSRGLNMSKTIVGDRVLGKKANIKALVVELVLIQHHKRLLEKSGYSVTQLHLKFMKDLLKLSTSAYSEVRSQAQHSLDNCFICFPYSYRLILDDVLPLLRADESISHEQFKGALYVLLGHKSRSLMTRHHWETLNKVWPAVIKAQHSEKPSIIALIDAIQTTVIENIESFQIRLQFPDSLINIAQGIWAGKNDQYAPSQPMPSDSELVAAKNRENAKSIEQEKGYYDIIAKLVELSNDPNLHWRHSDMAQSFLSLMIRLDMRFPSDAVQVFVRLLTHDSIKTRKMAVGFLAAALKIHRKPAKKTLLKIDELISQATAGNNGNAPYKGAIEIGTKYPMAWGLRCDNSWLTYRKEFLPKSSEEWESTVFLEKTHHGFYCWPKTLAIHAPTKEQPLVVPTSKDATVDELFIHETFSNVEFVKKFCQLLSLEEKKDEDHFHTHNYLLFKGLFRMYGSSFLEHFRPIVEKLMESTSAGEQRLAAEFAAGLISGAKLWTYKEQAEMWKWLSPILSTTLDNLSSETYKDWGTCVATTFDSRDPRKLHWFIEILLDLARKPMDASFNVACRYFLLQGGVNQQEWRVLEVWHELYKILEPHLAQPYQNLRDRLGSCLSTVYWFDIPSITVANGATPPPSRAAFLADVRRKLQILWTEVEQGSPDEVGSTSGRFNEKPERKNAILLLKTLLCYFNTHWQHAYVSAPPEIIEFLPLFCYFENETTDEELKRDCHWQLLQGMARALLQRSCASLMLDTTEKACNNKWWKARVSALQFLRVLLFSNLFFFWTDEHRKRVLSLLATALRDPQLEVREAASDTLSGFLHCHFVEINDALTDQFKEWAQNKNAVIRHGGVLGLAAVVKSCPYTVPAYLPDVLMVLCPYANDKQPVQAAVRKTLQEFKRTHYDCWHEHKESFTDDQLSVLTDLLVSPNYYV